MKTLQIAFGASLRIIPRRILWLTAKSAVAYKSTEQAGGQGTGRAAEEEEQNDLTPDSQSHQASGRTFVMRHSDLLFGFRKSRAQQKLKIEAGEGGLWHTLLPSPVLGQKTRRV